MKTCIIYSFFAIIIGIAQCWAGNLGSITSIRLLTGVDNTRYIEIGHSGHELQTTANTDFCSSGTWQNEPVYIIKPTDAAEFLAIWSMLQKAISNQSIQFYAINGCSTWNVWGQPSGNCAVRVDNFKFINQ